MNEKRDRGVVTAFVLGLAMCFMVTAGMAIDGGRTVVRLQMVECAKVHIHKKRQTLNSKHG